MVPSDWRARAKFVLQPNSAQGSSVLTRIEGRGLLGSGPATWAPDVVGATGMITEFVRAGQAFCGSSVMVCLWARLGHTEGSGVGKR